MDRQRIMLKNPADWTEEEQLFMVIQTDNSLKPEDENVDQPPQDPNWRPDPDEVVNNAHERRLGQS